MAQAAERAEARAARMVSRMDTDGDGKLSAAEMQSGPRRDGASGARFARMLERLDTDKDGALSREEWDAGRAAWAERGPRPGPKAD
jgi:Ca2+-binding EF-hand superfamily protein